MSGQDWAFALADSLEDIKDSVGDPAEAKAQLYACAMSLRAVIDAMRDHYPLGKSLGYCEIILREIQTVIDGRKSDLFNPSRKRGRRTKTMDEMLLMGYAYKAMLLLEPFEHNEKRRTIKVARVFARAGVLGWGGNAITAKTLEDWYTQGLSPTSDALLTIVNVMAEKNHEVIFSDLKLTINSEKEALDVIRRMAESAIAGPNLGASDYLAKT